MTPAQRRFLLFDNGLIPGVINIVVNIGLAWLSYRQIDSLPLWGPTSVGADLIGTCYLLPAITVLIATPLVRKLGNVPPLQLPRWLRWGASRFLIVRSIQWGVAGLLILGPPVLAGAWLTGQEHEVVAIQSFIIFKLIFVFVLGLTITPAIAAVALAD